jgi:hypothetical protein
LCLCLHLCTGHFKLHLGLEASAFDIVFWAKSSLWPHQIGLGGQCSVIASWAWSLWPHHLQKRSELKQRC